ncbi:MAG TPA: LCP family protein [Dermatophilaceae bacterium]|nr:LCP family protein [Dermatophilaceae bacterium]
MSGSPGAVRHNAGTATVRASAHPLNEPETMGLSLLARRAVTLLGLTLVLPGSAQVIAGNKRLGRAGLRVWLAVVLVAAGLGALAVLSRTTAIGVVTNSVALLLLTAALVLGAVFWAVLWVDTWRLTRPRSLLARTRRSVGLATAVLLLLTSGSMLYAAKQVYVGRNVLGSIFGGNTAVDAAEGRYNVLLLGGDSGRDRVGTRPDSITLVSIDADTGKPVMFGFARDTENINFRPGSLMRRLMPQGWNCGDNCLLNGLYTWGQDNKAKFPATVKNPGVEATKEAVEALSGLDIQYYVLIDLKGFQKLIDAMGGLTVDVKKRTPVGGGGSPVRYYIEPGLQKLNGFNALWYARSREGSNNYDRMARQRCVMDAMLQQLDPQTVVLKFQGLAEASSSVVQTDLPESELGRFADLALKARSQKIRTVNFVPPLMNPWRYDPKLITSTVAATIAAADAPPASKPSSAPTTSAATTATPKPARTTKGGGAAEADLTAVCSAG